MRLSGATTRDAVNDVTLTATSVTQSWSKVTACRHKTAYCARLHGDWRMPDSTQPALGCGNDR